MDKYVIIDIDIIMIMVLLIINCVIFLKNPIRTFSTRLFLLLSWSTILLLIADSLSWLTDGAQGSSYYLTYFTSFIFYMLEPLPLIAWLCYLDYQLHESVERLRKRGFYMFPLAISSLIMVYSLFTDFVFSVDGNNNYHRETGMYVVVAISILLIVSSFSLFFQSGVRGDRKVFHTTCLFGSLPVLGMIIQCLFYGSSFIWPSVALAVMFTYVYLETQKEIRDYLTGLINRQQMDDLLQSRIRDAGRKGAFSLLMVDFNDFKGINDTYGHKEGDRALVSVAAILSGRVKGIDRVARFGGDEFLILLEEEEPGEIEKIIRRINGAVEEENQKGGRPYRLSLSIGWAVFPPGKGLSLGQVIHEADLMMYENKSRIKNGSSLT